MQANTSRGKSREGLEMAGKGSCTVTRSSTAAMWPGAAFELRFSLPAQ
ncbi:hypothetical protein CLOSTMETH_02111 [[Clostridium] methylpentosum DSM 5476]|uniref:Uncharacterized protein n=1 Tax=[Clostridium] methylpentosum DSM 5476 TaxID=537013 RepID=C0EE32_9FIRM|nr:hypothetical protein CLOSTMETH_02111 [[Clostridium] methylpentosum DSM 5476]